MSTHIDSPMATIFDRLQAQLRASAHQNYEAVAAAPFTCFFHPDDPAPWSNYAIPDWPVAGDLTDALTTLCRVFESRERQPRFEFIDDYAPQLASALAAYGFTEEMRALLMVCTPTTYQPTAPLAGVTVMELTKVAPLAAIREFLTVQRRGFGNEDATAINESEAQQFRERFQTLRLFVASVDGQMVSAASLQPPHDGVTEIAGIATLRLFRRQGIGTLLTAYAVRAAFDQGVDTVFLTAGSAEAGRVYERAGFCTIGAGLAYSWPAVSAQT